MFSNLFLLQLLLVYVWLLVLLFRIINSFLYFQITKIENLNHLHELRVLNVAANKLKVIENLHGLHSLVEFNLRRNYITDVVSLNFFKFF